MKSQQTFATYYNRFTKRKQSTLEKRKKWAAITCSFFSFFQSWLFSLCESVIVCSECLLTFHLLQSKRSYKLLIEKWFRLNELGGNTLEKPSIYGLRREELVEWFLEHGEKKFRATQVWEWLYRSRVSEFSEMSNLSKQTIALLEENFICLLYTSPSPRD